MSPSDIAILMSAGSSVLKDFFIIHFARKKSKKECENLDIKRMQMQDGYVIFDAEKFLKDL